MSSSTAGAACTIEAAADALRLLCEHLGIPEGSTLVGYSLGARLALRMLCSGSTAFRKAVLLSATAGIEDPIKRQDRASRDRELADNLRSKGLADFLNVWYSREMWQPLRDHPRCLMPLVRQLHDH